MEILSKIKTLVEELNESGISYCHWKSNYLLAESLLGQTDIDLLIERKDANRFRRILSRLHFKPANTTDGETFPSVEHYYSLDQESGALVHVHAYFKVITGDSLTKNYHFPVEEMLLKNTRMIGPVRVPAKSAELVVFTLRMMLKHTSLVEILLLARYWKQVREEIDWLLEAENIDESIDFLRCYLPNLDPHLFSDCVAALNDPAPLYRRVILGNYLRSRLSFYGRSTSLQARLKGIRKFSLMFFRRYARSQKSMVLRNGGAVIAFVGSEATGKSTLIAETQDWLGEHFTAQQIHVGKPKSTLLTIIPNLFLPALRSIFPGARTTKIGLENQDRSTKPHKNFPLLFGIRSVLLAYDRRSLLSRAFRQASNGSLVLCDRYPSLRSGAPDSPQLSHLAPLTGNHSSRHRLANIEARLYREIPSPDLVIFLTAPIEVTISRNAARSKNEPESYVRRRHARSSNLEFGKAQVYKINTDQPLDQTVLEVRKAIWSVL
jgi:thymidylate kinase